MAQTLKKKRRRKGYYESSKPSKRYVEKRLGREECLATGTNCTKEQLAWREVFQMIRPVTEEGKGRVEHMSISFRMHHAAKRRQRTAGFPEDRTIHPIGDVVVATLCFVDGRLWARDINRARRYRANWLEHRLRIDKQTGDLIASTATDDEGIRERWRQRDALMTPIQDHPLFILEEFRQDRVLAQKEIYSPIDGEFQISRNSLHVTLSVRGLPGIRVLAEDAQHLVLHPEDNTLPAPGSFVKKGTRLAEFSGRTMYGVSEIINNGRGVRGVTMDRIGGWCFPASHRRKGEVDDLRLAIRMLRMVGTATTARDELPLSPAEHWMPRHLIEVPPSSLEGYIHCDDWEYTPTFRASLLSSLRHDSDRPLYVPANVSEPTSLVRVEDQTDATVLHYGNGATQCLPIGTAVLDSVLAGAPVDAGAPVADWVPRAAAWQMSWQDLAQVPYLTVIAEEFLRNQAIQPGTRGYIGDDLLIDASLLPDSITMTGAGARFVDFLPTAQYRTEEGTYVPPPLRQASGWTDTMRIINTIAYDATPRDCPRPNAILD